MKSEVRDTILWTLVGALLFFWFVSFAAKGIVTDQNTYVVRQPKCQYNYATPTH